MLKLTSKYIQTSNQHWDAFILEHPYIRVYNCEDLATAKVLLKIITAEEIAFNHHVRQNWTIVKEEINHYVEA